MEHKPGWYVRGRFTKSSLQAGVRLLASVVDVTGSIATTHAAYQQKKIATKLAKRSANMKTIKDGASVVTGLTEAFLRLF